jgi:chromosome segregation ATPase
MNFKKTVPAVVIASVIAGVGFAHGSTPRNTGSQTSTTEAMQGDADLKADSMDIRSEIKRLTTRLAALESQKDRNPDRTADIAAVKAEISKLRTRLSTLEAQKSSNPDRSADIATVKAEISKLRTRLSALEAQKSSNPDRSADIAAVKAEISKLRSRLSALEAQKSPNSDRSDDIAAVKRKIFMLKNRLKALRAENTMDYDRTDRDFRDHESPEASMHHDGDDHHPELGRSEFGHEMHREATREIMQGSRVRIARLYSPEHHSGYHAKMHRHSR